MIARTVFCFAIFAVAMATTVNVDPGVKFEEASGRKLDLSDGLYVELPRDHNATGKLFSFGVDGSKDVTEGWLNYLLCNCFLAHVVAMRAK